jgi:hypothetical protein
VPTILRWGPYRAFTATELVVTLVDGRKITTPLEWYPRLQQASAEQRANFEIMPMGIHWPDLDKDLGIVGMLEGRRGTPRVSSPIRSAHSDSRS